MITDGLDSGALIKFAVDELTIHKAIGQTVQLAFAEHELVSIEPVSYTHLDVYKRQVLYLVILAALLALLWLLVKRCQEYNVPGKVARVFSVFLCAAMALGCVWAQQGLSALGSMTSGPVSYTHLNWPP